MLKKVPFQSKHIILLGLPASGKSTLGELLASAFKMNFIDTDSYLSEKAVEVLGEEMNVFSFNRLIHHYYQNLPSLLKEIEIPSVIATGAEAVSALEQGNHFNELGCVIYLKRAHDKLLLSLEERNYPTFIETDNEGNQLEYYGIKNLLNDYQPFIPYIEEEANIIVDNNRPIPEVFKDIVEQLVVDCKADLL